MGDRITNDGGNGSWFDSRDWLRPGDTIEIRGTVPSQGGDGPGVYIYRGETYQSGVFGIQRDDAFWMEPSFSGIQPGLNVLGVSSLQYPNKDSFLVSAYDDLGPLPQNWSKPYVDARIRAEVTEFSILVTGDSNRDGAFDSGDLVTAFVGGKYGTGELASWEDGDWNSNTVFDSNDFVVAF